MELFPTFEALKSQRKIYRTVPVYAEIIVDHMTPVGAYAALRLKHAITYLLESVVGQEKWARYSFIGCDPDLYVRAKGQRVEKFYRDGRVETHDVENPLESLRETLAAYQPAHVEGMPRFWGGAVGYLGYDVVRWFEPKAIKEHSSQDYDFGFALGGTVVIFDNVLHTVKVVHPISEPSDDETALQAAYAASKAKIEDVVRSLFLPVELKPLSRKAVLEPAETSRYQLSHSKASFCDAVRAAQDYIRAGDVFQLVLSQQFTTSSQGMDTFDVYRALRTVNPSPYMFFLDFPEQRVAGASPEVMVRLEEGHAFVRPIAGTKPRGQTPEEDCALEQALLQDPKERAEHVMLVDLGRNDLGRVCEVGSVRVSEEMVVERYSHVMHIVSNVEGRLAAGRDAIDLLAATFPAGTLTGAPKVRAMQLIDTLEPVPRGLYGGSVGYLGYDGNMDMAIAIRTLSERDGRITVQAGAGLVEASDPESEYEETLSKSRAVRLALEMAAS